MENIANTVELDLEGKLDVNSPSLFDRFTDWYFSPKGFERSGKLYESLGVRQFKKIVMGTIGAISKKSGLDKMPSNYFIGENRDMESIKEYEFLAKLTEAYHTVCCAINVWSLVGNLSEGNYHTAAFWGSVLLLNSYCTMLQRYNRARVYNVLEKLSVRNSRQNSGS